MCVICVSCPIVVPLPPGKNPFAVKINNNGFIRFNIINICIRNNILWFRIQEREFQFKIRQHMKYSNKIASVTYLGCGLDGRGSIPSGGKFSFLHSVQIGSYPLVAGVLSRGVKRSGREADHSPI
jgi:hypothetical protein